ncbi:MAG: hypothetical protein ACXVRJ_02880 [Gaiellaceae bacterium]
MQAVQPSTPSRVHGVEEWIDELDDLVGSTVLTAAARGAVVEAIDAFAAQDGILPLRAIRARERLRSEREAASTLRRARPHWFSVRNVTALWVSR